MKTKTCRKKTAHKKQACSFSTKKVLRWGDCASQRSPELSNWRGWECHDGPWYYEFSDCGCCKYQNGPFVTRHLAEIDQKKIRRSYKKSWPLHFGEFYRVPVREDEAAA
jgi:hypothetical protein